MKGKENTHECLQKTAGRDLGRGGLTVPAGPSTAILSWLGTRRSAVRLDLPANGATVSRVMTGLRSGGYTLRQPLETDL